MPQPEMRRETKEMVNSPDERTSKPQIIRLGGREVIAEGLRLSFWADISHRCMTASWPAFIAGAALVFVVFNAVFALLYWVGNQPIANVPGGAYIDYLYFSIETLSTAGSGSTTAGSMRLWRDRLPHPRRVNIFCETRKPPF